MAIDLTVSFAYFVAVCALAECRIAPAAWLLYQSWLLYRFLLLPSLFWIHFLYYICHYINNYFSPIKRYKGTTGNLGRAQNSTRTKRCSEIIILQQIVLQAVTPVNYVTRAVSTALFCDIFVQIYSTCLTCDSQVCLPPWCMLRQQQGCFHTDCISCICTDCYKVSKWTVRSIRNVYWQELCKKRREDDEEMSSLPTKKRGRHVMLGEDIDTNVQLYMQKMREVAGQFLRTICCSSSWEYS